MEEEIWEFEDVRKDEQTKSDESESNRFSLAKLSKNSHYFHDLYWNPEGMVQAPLAGNQMSKMSQLSFFPLAEVPGAIIRTSPLIKPGARDGLIQILNQLDPVAFVNFSRTCKEIYYFCFNTKEIQVRFGPPHLTYWDSFTFSVNVHGPFTSDARVELNMVHQFHAPPHSVVRRTFSEDLKSLLKPPFVLTVDHIYFNANGAERVDSMVLEKLSEFLLRFHRVRLGNIYTEHIEDWNAFANFIEKFGAKRVDIPHTLPMDLLPIFINNVNEFHYHDNVPDDVILSASLDALHLRRAAISQETFRELFKRFHAGLLYNWVIGINRPAHLDYSMFDYFDIMLDLYYESGYLERDEYPIDEEQEAVPDPFLMDCLNGVKFIDVIRIDPTKMKPFVIYHKYNALYPKYYILLSDGSVGDFTVDRRSVTFGHTF